jgi:hypothetical protein
LVPTAHAGRRTTDDGRFVPPVERHGKTEVLVVTLPDRTRVELRYPKRLHLAELGFGTIGSVKWDVRPDPLRCCGRVLSIERTTIDFTYSGRDPIKTFPGAHGTKVPYFDSGTPLDNLVFQFGDWMVSVYNHAPGEFEDEMSDKELATWARSLDGRTDKNGYLVLDAHAPLKIERLVDFVLGKPEIGADQVEIADHYCGEPQSDTEVRRTYPGGVSWCDPGTGLHVSVVSEDPSFLRAVSRHLELRTLEPAS